MNFTPTRLPEVILVEPDIYRDERGFFLETWQERRYRDGGIDVEFVQDNLSSSVGGTLRGLHAQRRRPQGKLVRAVAGEIFDVAVDVRPGSPTAGEWAGATLTGENHHQLWVPPGFAHGFCVLGEGALVEYKCTDFYQPGDEIGVIWDDPDIGIDWPLEDPLLSDKDRRLPRLAALLQQLREEE